jgi:hypothetical protein
VTPQPLKAPFPYFGGKRAVAGLVWSRLGPVANYIEPFAGSLAVLLLRPPAPSVETVNDRDCYVANFWRATQHAPAAVAAHADGPVNEADLHARHRWLVLSPDAVAFRERMRSDPEYFDTRVAGWWCWGLCCWIGGGWCAHSDGPGRRPVLSAGTTPGGGINAGATLPQRLPMASGDYSIGRGVHASAKPPAEWQQVPDLHSQTGSGIHAGRPQLGDAYDIGRGVNGNGDASTCEARRAWLLDWFGRLRDRLRLVRVCCGDWSRVCSSESVTTRLGLTGVFFDPPYPRHQSGGRKSRDGSLYATDAAGKTPEQIRDELLAYCRERGGNPLMRLCVAGYEGDGYAELVASHGWGEVAWKAQGGYGNRTARGKENAARERLWFSPHCLPAGGPPAERTLFD